MHENEEGDAAHQTSSKDIVVGEDLATWSIADLKQRLIALAQESNRVEEAIKQKQNQALAAESLFQSETK